MPRPVAKTAPPEASKPKYRVLMDSLTEQIRGGTLRAGDKLPSEAAMVKKYGTSRITVGRALRELQGAGLVERRAGSGTYVRRAAAANEGRSLSFGLLIPDLGETEIFEPICQGIANAPRASDHALVWGHARSDGQSKAQQAIDLCRQYLERGVAGVFFAALEFERDAETTNRAILGALDNAGIPVVLLDHRPAHRTERRRHDLVGTNSRHAGYTATEHLAKMGARRIGFLAYHGAPSTIAARMTGYEAALRDWGLQGREVLSSAADESSPGDIDRMDGWVCVNDRVAGQLMQSLLAAGIKIPREVRIVGIDDAPYASLLSVPLTTVRQPCRLIGEAALATMLERIENPSLPTRDLLLDGELIVRESCGARLSAGNAERGA